MRYFFYGSLRDLDMLSVVLGRTLHPDESASAVLEDHRLVKAHEEEFPLAVPAPGFQVNGIVFTTGISEDEQRIRFFEDYDFELTTCHPVLSGGIKVEALFCGVPTGVEAEESEWDFEEWRRRHKHGFLRVVRAFMECYGTMSAEEAEKVWDRAMEEHFG